MTLEICLGYDPVVMGEDSGEVVMWDLDLADWACSCDHEPRRKDPYCDHIGRVARHLGPKAANALINARRAAGLKPTANALNSDRRMHPGEATSPTYY